MRQARPTKSKNIITNRSGTSNIQRVQSAWQEGTKSQPSNTTAGPEEPKAPVAPKPKAGKKIQITTQESFKDFKVNK